MSISANNNYSDPGTPSFSQLFLCRTSDRNLFDVQSGRDTSHHHQNTSSRQHAPTDPNPVPSRLHAQIRPFKVTSVLFTIFSSSVVALTLP